MTEFKRVFIDTAPIIYYLENSFSDFGSIGMCYYGVILLSGQGE